MSDELTRVLERVRQNRARGVRNAREVFRPGAAVSGRAPGGFVAGDFVFDLVSGEAGEVVSVTSETVNRAAAER